jgi:hypothetical protein
MNLGEQKLFDALCKKGFTVLRNGWPDFLCIKREYNSFARRWEERPKGAMCVESRTGKDKVSEDQAKVHAVLRAVGLPVYIVNPNEFKYKGFPHATFLTYGELEQAKSEIRQLTKRVAELELIVTEATYLLGESVTYVEKICVQSES